MALVDNHQSRAGSDTSSLSVNQYRRINFWTAILGQILSPFPAFFDGGRIYEKRLAIFLTTAATRTFLFCFLPRFSV
jgi:hypothetical protein